MAVDFAAATAAPVDAVDGCVDGTADWVLVTRSAAVAPAVEDTEGGCSEAVEVAAGGSGDDALGFSSSAAELTASVLVLCVEADVVGAVAMAVAVAVAVAVAAAEIVEVAATVAAAEALFPSAVLEESVPAD